MEPRQRPLALGRVALGRVALGRVALAACLLGGAVVGSSCASVTSPAATVGDVEISRDDVDEILTAASADERFAGGTPGTVTGEISASVVGVMIQDVIISDELERRDLVASDEATTAARTNFEENELPADLIELLAPIFARQNELQAALQAEGVDGLAFLQDAYSSSDITVDGRFGRWDAETFQVLPNDSPSTEGGAPADLLPS